MAKKCPKCGSKRVGLIPYRGIKAVVCGDCGFDETDELDMGATQRKTQREKRSYNPYRSRK